MSTDAPMRIALAVALSLLPVGPGALASGAGRAGTVPLAVAAAGPAGLASSQRAVYSALQATQMTDPSGEFRFARPYSGANAALPQVFLSFSTIHAAGGQIVFSFANAEAIAPYLAGGSDSPIARDAAAKANGPVTYQELRDTRRQLVLHLASRAVADNMREVVWAAAAADDVLIVVNLSRGPAELMTREAASLPVQKTTLDDAVAAVELAYDHVQQLRMDAGDGALGAPAGGAR